MKKIVSFAIMLFVTGCGPIGSKYGKGGDNACQYVKEQVPGLRDDIASIEVIEEDSLLGDLGLTFASLRLANVRLAYSEDRTTIDEVRRVADSCLAELMHVENSWKYGVIPNDKKHKSQLRRVYTVRVTMKSSDVKEPRVLMDNDGVTPRMIESDFIKELTDYSINFAQ